MPLPSRRDFSWLSRCALAAIALTVSGCGEHKGNAPENSIAIGEFTSLTGDSFSFGMASHHGVMLAIEGANASGGLLGRSIRLIAEDSSKAGGASAAVRRLILGRHAVALIGDLASDSSLEAAHIAQVQKIPMISPAATSVNVTKPGDYIFRACFIDPFQGAAMAKFTLESLKKTRVALLTDLRQEYSLGLAESYRQHVTANGGVVVADQLYKSGDQEFEGQLIEIQAAEPEVIFVPGYYYEVGLIVQQAREFGMTIPILGGDGWDSADLIKQAGSALENTFFCTHFSADEPRPAVQEFVRIYRERHRKPPDNMAALGFDTARLLLDAMTRAGSVEPARIRDALAATKHFEGVTGRIAIDAQRNAIKPAVVLTTKGKHFRYVETITPSYGE